MVCDSVAVLPSAESGWFTRVYVVFAEKEKKEREREEKRKEKEITEM